MDSEPIQATTEPVPDGAGGLNQEGIGGHSGRGESGLTEIREKRLIERAIRNGWIAPDGKRWPTDSTVKEIQGEKKKDDLTIREKAAIAVGKALDSKDNRVKGIAVKSVVAMEAQNQRDQLDSLAQEEKSGVAVSVETNGQQTNVGVKFIKGVDEEWL